MPNYYNEAGLKASIDELSKCLKETSWFSTVFNMINVVCIMAVIVTKIAISKIIEYAQTFDEKTGIDMGLLVGASLGLMFISWLFLVALHPLFNPKFIRYNHLTKLAFYKKTDRIGNVIFDYCFDALDKMDNESVPLSVFLKQYEKMILAVDTLPYYSHEYDNFLWAESRDFVVKENIHRCIMQKAARILTEKYPEFHSYFVLRRASNRNFSIIHADYKDLYSKKVHDPILDTIRVILNKNLDNSDLRDELEDEIESRYKDYKRSDYDDCELIKMIGYSLRKEFEFKYIAEFQKLEQFLKNEEVLVVLKDDPIRDAHLMDVFASISSNYAASLDRDPESNEQYSKDINAIIDAVDLAKSNLPSTEENAS